MKPTLKLKPKPNNILIISMRYLGDVLLTTPLIKTIKQAYPTSKIDVLVYTNTASMLSGNPDINEIIITNPKPSWKESCLILKKLYRRYDVSIVTQTGDRRIFYAFISASLRIGFVPPNSLKNAWKRFVIDGRVEEYKYPNLHTVQTFLKLASVLKLPLNYDLTPPQQLFFNRPSGFDENEPYAVLHLHPQWRYKQWHSKGWVQVANHLYQLGVKIILTGSQSEREQKYIQNISQNFPKNTLNLAGKLDLADLTFVISKAKLYIGPDTGITHLAAATGIPVIAIFGPTNPAKWAPWPINFNKERNAFMPIGNQTIGNVFLIQGKADCVPCQLEGCEQHRESYSKCLDDLNAKEIVEKINQILT